MDMKSGAFGLSVGLAISAIAFVGMQELVTAKGNTRTVEHQRNVAEASESFARQMGDQKGAEMYAARAAEATQALAKAKQREAEKEAAAEVGNAKILATANAELPGQTATDSDVIAKQDALLKKLNGN